MTGYPADLKWRLALALLRGETSGAIALRSGVSEDLIIEWALKIAQRSQQVLEDGAGADIAARSPAGRVCFLHIEKSGGTTLASHLEDQFDSARICPALRHEDLLTLALQRNLLEFDLLHGHFFLGWFLEHTALDFGNTRFVTVLRHPLSRAVSYYKHWLRQPPEFGEYVNRLLGSPVAQLFRLSRLPMRRGYATVREHLEDAKGALEELFFVGIHERFAESAAALLQRLGRPVPSHLRALNADPHDHADLPQALADEILERSQADLELYEHAAKLFERKFARGATAPGAAPAPAPAGRVALRMDEAIFGDGWHYREGIGSTQPQSWRWSGPQTEAWLGLHLVPGRDYRFSVRIVNFLAPDVLANVRIHVNDTPIALTEARDSLWGLILHGTVPAAALAGSFPNVRLRFSVGRTIRFSDVDPGSRDQRPCGIAVSEVNLQPLPAAAAGAGG